MVVKNRSKTEIFFELPEVIIEESTVLRNWLIDKTTFILEYVLQRGYSTKDFFVKAPLSMLEWLEKHKFKADKI